MSENEYKEWVLAAYDRQVATGQLASELLSPTPANIKAEALKICEHELNSEDEKILRSFVGQKDDIAAYHNAIRNKNADPFRPLVNFLDDRSINTNLRNINLLALLIDFKPRPYRPNLIINGQLDVTTPPLATVPPDDTIDVEDVHTPIPSVEPLVKPKKRIIIYGLLLIFISVTIYFVLKKGPHQLTGKEGCMIWSNDHYEPVDCSDHSSGLQLLTINHQLVDHFKRITEPDTLTAYSVRKVWYAKYKGRVEFYTDSGIHPLDTSRRLLPMTFGIWQKYVLHTIN